MKPRFWFAAILAAFSGWVVVALWTGASAGEPSQETTGPEPSPPTTTVRLEKRVQGKTANQWHSVAARYLSRKRSLQIAIHYDPQVTTAINLACTIYGHCTELWSKARCESKLYRFAHNPSGASGLFQFLPSTWSSTPFARFSVYDATANALAAGWMHSRGRGGEWVCR